MRIFSIYRNITQKKSFLIWNLIAFFLLSSFFSPLTQPFWSTIDLYIFRLLNGSLKGSPNWQAFFALANHKSADWIEDIFILGFYSIAIYKTNPKKRKYRILQFIFCICLTALTITIINRILFQDILNLKRNSPSRTLLDFLNISHCITWISFKVKTTRSFPADHATMALMIFVSYAYFVRGKLGVLAIFYGILLCLPRLFVGAHWVSDVIIGSGSIVIFSLTWTFSSPLCQKLRLQT